MICPNENCQQCFIDHEKLKKHCYLHVRNNEETKCFYNNCRFVSEKYNSYKNHINFHKAKNDQLIILTPTTYSNLDNSISNNIDYQDNNEQEELDNIAKLSELYMNTYTKYKVNFNIC